MKQDVLEKKPAKVEKLKKKDIYYNWFAVAPGVWGMRDVFVNIYMIHNPTDGKWVLVDAGLKWSAAKIRKMAEHLFWPESQPSAIVLTHGHFDHIGSLVELAEEWDAPVYAHKLEKPFLTGKSSYPPPDPSVGGGLMSVMSFLYPKGPINIEDKLRVLPEDGSIPGLPGWRYIHTPGHSPGHISLFRDLDRVLIAGDAFVTTRAESATSIALQTKALSGPPKYFTCNWATASDSVQRLAALEPDIVSTGHGMPMRGKEMRNSLHNLSENFETLAKPSHGRYVDDPAISDETGVTFVPPSTMNTLLVKVVGISVIAVLGIILYRKRKTSLF